MYETTSANVAKGTTTIRPQPESPGIQAATEQAHSRLIELNSIVNTICDRIGTHAPSGDIANLPANGSNIANSLVSVHAMISELHEKLVAINNAL